MACIGNALYLDFYLPIGTRLFNQGVRKSFEIPILIKKNNNNNENDLRYSATVIYLHTT